MPISDRHPTPVNPFYAVRRPSRRDHPATGRVAAPGTGNAPAPHEWEGDLIRSLIGRLRPVTALDSMAGSGTCGDLCRELGVHCASGGLKRGRDACDPDACPDGFRFDLVWAHPPYWRTGGAGDDPRCLSRAPTLDAFLDRYGRFVANMARLLSPEGRLAVPVGDFSDPEVGVVPLADQTRRLGRETGLVPDGTDRVHVVRGQRETCVVFRRP